MQYFRPSLSYYLSLRSLFCLFLSGRFTKVLPYMSMHVCKIVYIFVPLLRISHHTFVSLPELHLLLFFLSLVDQSEMGQPGNIIHVQLTLYII